MEKGKEEGASPIILHGDGFWEKEQPDVAPVSGRNRLWVRILTAVLLCSGASPASATLLFCFIFTMEKRILTGTLFMRSVQLLPCKNLAMVTA